RREQEGQVRDNSKLNAKSFTKQKWKKVKRETREISEKLEPWRSSIKAVEGYHGSGVASYFMFMRWSAFLNIGITGFILVFVTLPGVAFPPKNYLMSCCGGTNQSIETANTCSKAYILNTSSSDTKTLLLDFIQGSGWMEKTALFYGYYKNEALTTDGISYMIPLAYLLVTMACLFFSVILLAKKSASNFRHSVEKRSVANSFQFYNLVFVSWDYTITDNTSAKLKKCSIRKQIEAELAEKQYRLKKDNLTKHQRICLYAIRIAVNIFVLACLGASAFLIFRVTKFSTDSINNKTFIDKPKILKLLVEFLPPLTMGVLNGFVPIIFSFVTRFEDYAPQKEVYLTLVRTILLKLASLIFLVASLYKDVMCRSKDGCRIGKDPCPQIKCWETYIGQQFYKLVITGFATKLIMCLLVEPFRKLIAIKLKLKVQKQFNVPQDVLDLIYVQSLCWLGFFFAPLISLMVLIEIFFTFYLKKLSALHWCTASEKAYKASKSQSLFASLLMGSFFLCCLPIGYVIRKVPPSASCGPFRIYNHMYDILTFTASTWPITTGAVVSFLTSGAFIIIIIIILLLFLYYFYQKIKYQSRTVNILTERLESERKEKYYFMVEASKLQKQLHLQNEDKMPLKSPDED
ncbi:transmembrane channel-like protein 7, partial [Argonauta hians]